MGGQDQEKNESGPSKVVGQYPEKGHDPDLARIISDHWPGSSIVWSQDKPRHGQILYCICTGNKFKYRVGTCNKFVMIFSIKSFNVIES